MKLDLLILAIAPSIAFILWIYIKDKYNREPIMVLGKFFLFGIFVSIIAIMIEEFLVKVNNLDGIYKTIYMSFIVAGVVEEGLKAVVLIPNLLNEKSFDEKLDGIIYSIYLSLGFATVENLIYILLEDISLAFNLGIIRAIISIPAHMLFAINMGYYISKYKFSNKEIKKREYIVMAILIPILLHGIFDFILMINSRLSSVIFILFIVLLWKFSLDKLDEYTDYSRIRFLRNKNRRN